MERTLPTLDIEATAFIIDVARQELRERDDPANTISFLEMKDHGTHYILRYDPDVRNLPEVFGKEIIEVSVPQMVTLDPEGMSLAHGVGLSQLKGKTDFDLIVDQDLVKQRRNGQLPVIEIAGHPFYVDVRIGLLRPKDDFSTMGISFDAIDHCLKVDERMYEINYNPASKEFVYVDYRNITSMPEGVIIVEIPHESILDPIAYARKYGFDEREMLRANPPQEGMKARTVPWKETPIEEILADNIKRKQPGSLIIQIGDEQFLLDRKTVVLQPLIRKDGAIDLDTFDTDVDGREYIGFYDTNKRAVVHPNDSNSGSPHLHMLIIPVELIRNPYRAENSKGYEPRLIPMNRPRPEKKEQQQVKIKKSKGKRI